MKFQSSFQTTWHLLQTKINILKRKHPSADMHILPDQVAPDGYKPQSPCRRRFTDKKSPGMFAENIPGFYAIYIEETRQ
ncbi:hypothetical protein [Candidatus Soleaferrea massiliensis]|uniref:hypothetical protein n=1 Tax=Candidatus Soleaferrea massiliensis TaxID=1470354 RepID=UPI0012E01203|nr:hypothetical protein [Candidatus Soleaferrea massiliensis]